MKKLAITVVVLGQIASAWAQVTERVSVDSVGGQAGLGGGLPYAMPVVSADGRSVVFMSASALDFGDTNGTWDVFVRDRLTGTTERVSVDSSGTQGNGASGVYGIVISPDGRYVGFESRASNLALGDTNGKSDIFVRDRLTGTTERLSLDSNGAQGNDDSFHPSISPDGRYVGFDSLATNLVPGDTNGQQDAYLRDRATGTTELLSVSTGGAEGNSYSWLPVLSADGRYAAFASAATNLVGADTNGHLDVFIRDRQIGLTLRVSRSSTGTQGNLDSYGASISSDGRYVAFASQATNLVTGDTNGLRDVFVNDRQAATTTRVSVATDGSQGNGNSDQPSISANGRYVAFLSGATNLVPNGPGSPNGRLFVRDLELGTTELVSMASDGSDPTGGGCTKPSISAEGRFVVFESSATNLVPHDNNGNLDVFIRDRFAAGFTSLCDPGAGNVIACPCGNQPMTLARGCDNSSFLGGAGLSAGGIAYLALDTLFFTTADEKPSATSIVLQGDVLLGTGLVFGQGVRCVGGSLRRMYVKTAVNGTITAPDPSAGDLSVSARSALLGDFIQPGEQRYYLVYYRDPIVLGGCAGGSTFNATQTGSVAWWP